MGLVNSVCIFVAELIKNGSDFVIVLGGNELTDDTFKSKSERVVSGSKASR